MRLVSQEKRRDRLLDNRVVLDTKEHSFEKVEPDSQNGVRFTKIGQIHKNGPDSKNGARFTKNGARFEK